MIYCIGLRMKYERAFAAPGPVIKLGRGVGSDGRQYPGGRVWPTAADAKRFLAGKGLDATHDVYGVLAEWESDTVTDEADQTRRLVRNAAVVRLT